jgi:4-hydroxybenzoate polyprenyltransferase
MFYAILVGYQSDVVGIGGYDRLKEIPLVKNLVPAVALPGLLLGTIVSLSEPHLMVAGVVFSFLFLRVLTGSIMPDMGDVEGDMEAGVSTLPVILNNSQVRNILVIGNILAVLPVLLAVYYGQAIDVLVPSLVITVLTLPVAALVKPETADKATFIHEVLDMYVFPAILLAGGYLPWL